MIMKTSMTARPPPPKTREGRAHEINLADEGERNAARTRIFSQTLFQFLGRAADIATLGLHQHMRDPCQVVALDHDWAQ